MVLELAIIEINEGENVGFETQLNLAQEVLKKAEGYISHEFKKCMEQDNKYILLINWQNLEAHTVGFRNSDLFTQWRGFIGSYFKQPPMVQHFLSV